ncbi:hypothetical protein A9P44_16095 [Paenibacillus polymyxa]|nr:hypothetical protein A9P44_16095 [Paenibacillus polymyxa]
MRLAFFVGGGDCVTWRENGVLREGSVNRSLWIAGRIKQHESSLTDEEKKTKKEIVPGYER